MKKKEQLRYLRLNNSDNKDPSHIVDWKTIAVEGDYINCYLNTFNLLYGLNNTETTLLFFLVQEMDDRNFFKNTVELKKNFNRKLKSSITDRTINRGLVKLVKLHLLIKLPKRRRGMYRVNPRFFFKGAKHKRLKEIRYDLEQQYKPDVNKYRAETFDKDKARKDLIKKKKDAK